ncbi:hypothetical protein BU16DRAFT_616239 [Lophium mytilinum]|uniref:Glycoside hydrolase n=1 Tax=Lophium mytilinum TaxID=390894 RepID=A0A6A6QYV0_9PEZI|nr:hypothetical protein BU16DRAFT_616239 [Lophium mytilinum]
MKFTISIASFLSIPTFIFGTNGVRISSSNHMFGGVNHQNLQYLDPIERDRSITAIVNANATVIRLFIRGNEHHADPETSLGEFDFSVLDQFDDTLAAIHRISNGRTKVIIAPHDAHSLRGSNSAPCDVYCKALKGAFLDFYSTPMFRSAYKNRLSTMFNEYRSKNFGGASWSALNQVILGVDLQNEPWSGVWPIVAGEKWLCDIATYLKIDVGLGKNNIAVITGGISGAISPRGTENFPDSAIDCPAVDVIAIHGYFSADDDQTAGTPWVNMFLPGNTLTSRLLGNKLLMVEELSYTRTKRGLHYKNADIWDQGNALNYRGIPWLFSSVTEDDEWKTGHVALHRGAGSAMAALTSVLQDASTARSNFDWNRYLPQLQSHAFSPTNLLKANPYIPPQSACTFGCDGWFCDAADGCAPGSVCKNNVCRPCTTGCAGATCDNHRQLCQESMQCVNGTCQECEARKSAKPKKTSGDPYINFSDPNGSCVSDDPFATTAICQFCDPLARSCRGSPCVKAADCDVDEYCDWGLCKPCTEGCLGMACKTSRGCKTGRCNEFGKCDYPGKMKAPIRPEDVRGRRSPQYYAQGGRQQGPMKVKDNAWRVNAPMEEVKATGMSG